jgi:sulfite exporter TauE/SafE
MHYLALLLGLTSSLHCVGMCGPIALALPVHKRSGSGKIMGIALYNLGRISVYALMGAVIGSIGFLANIGNWQQALSVGAGVLLIITAVGSFGWLERLAVPSFFRSRTSLISQSIQRRLSKDSFASLTIMGMLNGLLPCGMIYLALASALAMNSALSGAAYMALFGLGTVPAMMATGIFGQWASVKWRLGFKKVTPYLIVVAGVILILRGLQPVEDHQHTTSAIPICVGK